METTHVSDWTSPQCCTVQSAQNVCVGHSGTGALVYVEFSTELWKETSLASSHSIFSAQAVNAPLHSLTTLARAQWQSISGSQEKTSLCPRPWTSYCCSEWKALSKASQRSDSVQGSSMYSFREHLAGPPCEHSCSNATAPSPWLSFSWHDTRGTSLLPYMF